MTPAGARRGSSCRCSSRDLFPWAPLVVVPLLAAWRRAGPGESATHASIRRLLWIWIVVIVAFFSLSATKEDLYIFPVVAGRRRAHRRLLTSEDGLRRRATGAIFVSTAAICVVLAAGVFWWFRDGYYRLDAAVPVAVVLGAGGLGAIALWLRGRRAPAIATLAAGFIAFNYFFVGRVLPDVERLKPVPPLARTFTSRAAPDARLAQLNMSLPSLRSTSIGRCPNCCRASTRSICSAARPRRGSSRTTRRGPWCARKCRRHVSPTAGRSSRSTARS